MFTKEINKRASRIRKEIKKAGYTKKVWSAALKCAYRYEELTKLPKHYEGKEYQIVKKNGEQRTIKGVFASMANETTIRMKDLENEAKFKSFRIWQLLTREEQPIF